MLTLLIFLGRALSEFFIFIDREAREIMHLVASVRLYVYALMVEPFDLRP